MSKHFRQIKLVLVSVCALSFLPVTNSGAQNPPSEQAFDAVCKTAPMPAGFVAVGEMESPECKESDPGRKNAWLIDRVRDKIVSCAPPDYASGYPPAIAYMTCERVQAGRCPSSIDGTPNGFLLTAGKSCRNPRVKSVCLEFRFNSTTEVSERVSKRADGLPDFTAPIDVTEELEFWKLSVAFGDASCPKPPDGPDRVFYLPTLRKGEPLPLCAEFNDWEVGQGRYGLHLRLSLHNVLGLNTKVIVIRQFYTDLCPQYNLGGQPQALNAFVVQRLDRQEWTNRDIFMCASSLRRKPKRPLEIISGSGGTPIEDTAAEAYQPSSNYTVKRVYQDDRCGIGAQANAYTIRFEK
jgi:hypothetical protein